MTALSIVVDNTSLSTDEFNEISFDIYPNPTTDKVTITTLVEKVTIYNITGKEVFETNKPSFSVKELQTGLYLLQIQTKKGIAVRKLVKK